MKCLSLFSGIGGFDLALQRQGYEIVGASEIDRYARQIYSRHFPKVKIWWDATRIEPSELPDFDLLCAGFPCQAFSIAGKRLGFEESRGTLFFEIARIARQKRPRFLLLENVKGLLSHDRGKTFAVILSVLDELGYDAEWQVLNSKYFVPQNRERIFIIGHLREKSTQKIFPFYESKGVSSTKVSIESESQEGIRCEVSCIDSRYGALRNTGETYLIAWSKSHRTGKTESDKKRHNYGKIENRIKIGEANCLNTGDGAGNQSTQSFVITDEQVRKLTPLECERLQGFPDGWTEGISDTQRYKCIGNAVTVPVVEFIIQKIRSVSESK